MAKNYCKLSNMVGEHFEIYQMGKNYLKLSAKVGGNIEIY